MVRIAVIACLVAVAGAAEAQSVAPYHPVTVTLGAATDYRSRGISKSDDDGFAYLGAEWKSADALLYVGAQAATVNLATGATYEVEGKIGSRPKLGKFAFDFTALYRVFPDARPGTDDDFVEFRAQVSRAFGPVTIRGLTWYTPDNVGPAKAATWSDIRATWRVAPHARVSASLGRHVQEQGVDYQEWNAGAAFDLTPKMELDLRWYDTSAHEAGPRYDGEAVAAITYKF